MSRAIVERACVKLRSAIGDGAVVRSNFTGDLRDMLEALEAIQPVVEDAEIPMFVDEYAESWLQHAQQWLQRALSAAYKIIDTVDELQDARSRAAATIMLPRLAIRKKVHETKELVMRLQEESRELSESLAEHPSHGLAENPIMFHEFIEVRKTGAVFEEAMALGRGSDKERIMAALLSTEHNIILPIFGFAGSGKTTLAQMVFTDTDSLQGYDFRVWIHVSPKLDFHTIGKSIIRQVSPKLDYHTMRRQEEIYHSSSDMEGMENTMQRLHKLLNGKKVLLVLDDLWEEDPIQLQLLKSMLTFLGDKMDVIVTTCNKAIARKICTAEPYRLRLSDDTCWEIIKKTICFEGGEELEMIAQEIGSKCQGVPSVAWAYAVMLDSSRDAMRWKQTLLERDIEWFTLWWYESHHKPVSTFELSYRSMPPDLRLCFAYCCQIFPINHIIIKDDLVHQWIALQLIEPSEILSATQIAEEHITRLQDLSFLQTAELNHASGKDDKGVILFTVHALVHFLMKRFLASLNYRLVTNHHGKLDYRYNGNLRALRCVGCSKVEFDGYLFSSQKCLRVLELKESPMQKLPDNICQLRHLGYLQISEFSGLVSLPESFGDMKNLFHVNLSGCSGLAALPESFGNLESMSHINLSRCHGLAELPEPLQKLRKLVHLDLSFWSCFKGIGEGLGRLTGLEHLNLSNPCCYPAQHPSHLQGLKDGLRELKDGLRALKKLRYLNLSMCLNPIFYHYKSQEDSPQYIGDCVKDLSNLEHLDLSHHTFLFGLPTSLGELNKLKTLNLSGCIRLKKVGEMKSLKFIDLRKCRGLESCHFVVRVDDDDDAYSSSNIVQLEEVNCQELQISCLEKVKSKEEAQRIKLVEKLKLQKLKLSWTLDTVGRVEDSALLRELVPPPNLQRLEVHGYTGTCLPEYLSDLTSLQELKIVCCKQLNSLPDTMQKLTSLKDLRILYCPELAKWCQVEENKKMLAHIPNKNYEEPASTSRPEIEEDGRLGDKVEAA